MKEVVITKTISKAKAKSPCSGSMWACVPFCPPFLEQHGDSVSRKRTCAKGINHGIHPSGVAGSWNVKSKKSKYWERILFI